MRIAKATLSLLGLILLGWNIADAQKISSTLQRRMDSGKAGDTYICWISFTDKQDTDSPPTLGQKTMSRRQKIGRALSFGDLPVSPDYLFGLRQAGVRIRVVSPWLNAVSAEVSASQVKALAAEKWVQKVDLVARYIRIPETGETWKKDTKDIPALEYGSSDLQIKLLGINDLHAKGYTGSGVRILIIDTGFDREHETLLRTNVIAERDFQRSFYDTVSFIPLIIDTIPDAVTSFEPDQDVSRLQTQHGTGMLSIIGGYKNGSLIGSAYNADFVLAKTEMKAGEDFVQEEDWWVAAIQWGDSLGIDIASSSLGYRHWLDSASYSYANMNGETAFCSRAADSAVSRGIVVVNSQGNINSATTRPDTCIVAPADADSIISVGGVWPATGQWAFSTDTWLGPSAGPPADSLKIRRTGGDDSLFIRRIKPDVAATWETMFADNMDTVNYSRILIGPGTSGAAALTAGLCALLLEAHPHWGPGQVIEALKYSGSNKTTVDTFLAHPESLYTALGAEPSYNPGFSGVANGHRYYIDSSSTIYDFYDVYRIGWGIPNGMKALEFTEPEVVLPSGDQLLEPYPNPVKPGDTGLFLPYFLARDSYNVSLVIFSLDGRPVRKLDYGTQLAGEYPGKRDAVMQRSGGRPGGFWDLKDSKGNPAPSGLYLVVLSTGWNQSVKKVVIIR
jgi:subtilisin family serine protease